MEKSVKVSAKYIQKKTCWAKNNREKEGILGKIQWRKHKGFGKIHTKKTCWAKNNRKRRHFGQNTMEKSVKVSAKYIPKKNKKRRHFGQNTMKKSVKVSAKNLLGKKQ